MFMSKHVRFTIAKTIDPKSDVHLFAQKPSIMNVLNFK